MADDTNPTFWQLLSNWRPPRWMCFMLGAWSVAMVVLLWAGEVRPMSVIRECEGYRVKFGADPVYRFGISDFHCEFQKADLEQNGFHARHDKSAPSKI